MGAYGEATDAKLEQLISRTSDLVSEFTTGRVRSAGGKITVPATSTAFFCLSNPTGSGKVVTLREFTLAATLACDVQFRFDAVLATPTALTPFLPNRAVAGTTVATAGMSTAAPSTAGTTLSPIYRLRADQALTKDFTIVLTPGQSVAAAVTVGATATDFYASATWTEA